MSEQDPNQQSGPELPNGDAAPDSPGAQLRMQRESHGWTVEQVAAQLNLAPRQVLAIESDNHAALPGASVTRGFIRAYAKLLRMDAAPLLVSLSAAAPASQESLAPRKVLATPFSEARLPSMSEKRGGRTRAVIGAGLLLLTAAAAWFWLRGPELPGLPVTISSSQNSETAPKLPATPEPAPEGTPAVPPRSEPSLNPPATPPDAAAAPDAAGPVPPAVQAPSTNAPAAPGATPAQPAPAESPAASAAPAEAAGKDVLLLEARDDSWVEVRRSGNNGVLFSRLMKSGESQSLEVSEPVAVVVGNASAVELRFRNEPVQLKGGKGNVARLTLK